MTEKKCAYFSLHFLQRETSSERIIHKSIVQRRLRIVPERVRRNHQNCRRGLRNNQFLIYYDLKVKIKQYITLYEHTRLSHVGKKINHIFQLLPVTRPFHPSSALQDHRYCTSQASAARGLAAFACRPRRASANILIIPGVFSGLWYLGSIGFPSALLCGISIKKPRKL